MNREKSEQIFAEAQQVLVGGVNSPVRAFKSVGGAPIVMARGEGAMLFDVDGNAYIDYVGSWGPLILGHAHPEVVPALNHALSQGTSFGTSTEVEVKLAQKITSAFPGMDQIRFVNSGTEATMSALRLARAFTKRDKIIKFDGGYHGHADLLLVQAGSGVATLGLPDSPGVPHSATQDTISVSFNDLDVVKEIFNQHPDQIAAIIVEPVAGNMGLILPEPNFLSGLKKITKTNDALLIFDEVMTGYRVAYGGAQTKFDIQPDLTCLGKVIGGGLPVGAYAGRKEIMSQLAPLGSVYQAGTLSGNPLAMTAGLTTIGLIEQDDIYDRLETLTQALTQGLRDSAKRAGMPVEVNQIGSMFNLFFSETPVKNYEQAKATQHQHYTLFFQSMLDQGIYLPPSPFETWFMSLAHTDQHIEQTLDAAKLAFYNLTN